MNVLLFLLFLLLFLLLLLSLLLRLQTHLITHLQFYVYVCGREKPKLPAHVATLPSSLFPFPIRNATCQSTRFFAHKRSSDEVGL